MIYAPFNFVPLSEKVYFPDWASQISQDVPFSDGRSGKINIKIKAVTPIFIRNGHTPDDKENWNSDFIDFSHTPDGRYFIPATSIKGMVRNILEIISFGKMSRITNKRYSIRDLYMRAYTNYFRNHEIHCGWMVIDEKQEMATITDHGIPGRISADEIDSHLHIGLSDFVHEKERGNLTKTINRYAKAKYDLLKRKHDISLDGRFREIPNENDNKVDNRQFVQFSDTGLLGTIVFTGQPGRRKDKRENTKASGKFFEFVFYKNIQNTYEISTRQEGGIYDDFCFIYKDSEDWRYWQKQDKVPVFFTLDKNDDIEYMGLSYMFRLPTKKHINEFLNKEHLQNDLDLAECVFGVIGDNSLKGRVQFSHAFCLSDSPQVGEMIEPYMASPKPSYYPIYTQQKGTNGKIMGKDYKTFLDSDAKLRGWKKYPVRKSVSAVAQASEDQKKNASPFKPLLENSEFECTVRYHNLREIELGALLFALNPFDDCCFSLGFCKPYGYGVVKIEITSMSDEEIWQLKHAFVSEMETKIDNFEQSPQLRELKAMMMISEENKDYPLEYMKGPDEFARQKSREYKQYLQEYSSIRIKTQSEIKNEKERLLKEIERKKNLELAILENKRKTLELEEQLQREADEAAEIARKEQELAEQKRQAEKVAFEKENKLNLGLAAILDEVYPIGPNTGKYKVTTFKMCESKCTQWLKLKNTNTLSDDEKSVLASVLTRLKNNPDKKEKKLWENKGSFIWKTIRKLLGEDWQGEPFE